MFQWPSLCFIIYFIYYLFSVIFFTFLFLHLVCTPLPLSVSWHFGFCYNLFLVISLLSALFQSPASLCFAAYLLALLSFLFFISNFFLCFVVSLDSKLTYLTSWDDIHHTVYRRLAQLNIIFCWNHVRCMLVEWQKDRLPLVGQRSVTNSSFGKTLIHLVEKSGKRPSKVQNKDI